jgi:GDP-4-dehydro-6-deoxy-D-mannose reductase
MKKNILVTGVSGFAGKHLAREIASRDFKVYGVGRDERAHPEIASILSNYTKADLTNVEEVAKLPLDNIDVVINLAALAKPGVSFQEEERYLRTNLEVATIIANQILKKGSPIRFIAISTGGVYDSNQQMPLTEDSRLIEQGSPYARSKVLMENALNKLRDQGLDCVLVRPFNHIGPGQEQGFLVPDLYQKLLTAQESGEPLHVGDLTTKRDFTDVRDVVSAYTNLAEAENLMYSLYNICSGKSFSGEDILHNLMEAMSMRDKVRIEQDPSLIRPNDPKDLYGNNQRISEVAGWRPTIPLEKTISDFVDYQRQHEQ